MSLAINQIHLGDARELLQQIELNSVQYHPSLAPIMNLLAQVK